MIVFAAVQVQDYCGRGREYAEKLFAGIRKHVPAGIEWRGACLTDDPTKIPAGVEAISVPAGLVGWWTKIFLFHPEVFPRGQRIVFCDLDTLILGDLSGFAAYSGPFAVLRDPYHPGHIGSAIMAWQAGTLDHVWTRWDQAGRPSFHSGGDQRWIEVMQPRADYWDDLLPGQVVSFKAHCRPLGRIPDGVRVCYFHGEPRPHECEESFIQSLWNQPPLGLAA